MIASTPVARWTWGRDHEETDTIQLCLRDLLAAYAVLATQRLAVGAPIIHVRISEAGNPRNYLFDGIMSPEKERRPEEIATEFANKIKQDRQPGRIGSVDADVDCTGMVGLDGLEAAQEKLFRLGTNAYRDYVTTDLVTFSDVSMAYDLKGHPQPAVHAANQPRLAAALHGLAEVLDSETDPEDPTYFGTPTETGIDNHFERDGSPSDVWSRFEETYTPGPLWGGNS